MGTDRPTFAVALLAGLLALGGVLAWWPPPTEADTRAAGERVARDARAPGPTPPVDLAPGTSYVETRVLASGDLRVTHWIRSRAPLREVRLAPVAPADRQEETSPRATRVRLAVDGRRVRVPSRVEGTPVDLAVPAGTSLHLTYLLRHALDRGADEGGVLRARALSLSVELRPSLRARTHAVTGAAVQTLSCRPAPGRDPLPCGRPRNPAAGADGTWLVRLRGDRVGDRVTARLEPA